MSWIETASNSYAEAAANAIPLHRAALFLTSTLIFVAYGENATESSISYFLKISAVDIFSLSSPLIKKISVGDIMIGVATVLASILFARSAVCVLFALALRSTSLIERISAKTLVSSSLSIVDRNQAIELVEKSLEKPARRIRAINRIGEFSGGLGLLLTGVGITGGRLDLLIGVSCIFFSFLVLTYATKVFLTDYFGSAVYVSKLQGGDIPKPGDV